MNDYWGNVVLGHKRVLGYVNHLGGIVKFLFDGKLAMNDIRGFRLLKMNGGMLMIKLLHTAHMVPPIGSMRFYKLQFLGFLYFSRCVIFELIK